MKVQRIGIGRRESGDIYKTYVNVPSWARADYRLEAGPVFLCLSGRRAVQVLKERRYADDYKAHLTEHVTRKYGNRTYTVLRMIIPAGIVERIGIQKGDSANMSEGKAGRPVIVFSRGKKSGKNPS